MVVLVVTAAFMVVEFAAGLISGSLALVADAGHMLTDVGALGLSWFTAMLARRPADLKRTYGYLRWEILAALINGATLFGLSAWVVYQAIGRISQPQPIDTRMFLIVAAAGLVANLFSLSMLHGLQNHSLNVRGAYLHIMGDIFGSVAALAAAVIVSTTGWTTADPLVSILLSLLILFSAWRLLRESTAVLLETVPRHLALEDVRDRMLEVPGVRAVHDLHVWTVTSGVIAMSGHAVVPELEAHPGALAGLRQVLTRMGIGHATIQLEVEDECGEGDCLEPVAPLEAEHGHRHGRGHRHHH